MAVNWRWGREWTAPELLLLETNKERKQVYKTAFKSISGRHFLAAFVLFIVARIVTDQIVRTFNLNKLGFALTLSVMFLLACFPLLLIGRRRIRHEIRRQLNERGIHVCMGCAYRLEGLTVPRCPECGMPFDPARFGPSLDPSDRSEDG